MSKINITYKNIKNLRISIDDSLNINVTSPIGVNKKYIEDIIQSKSSWIAKHKQKILNKQKYNYTLYDLEENGLVYLLGEQYSIKIVNSSNNIIQCDEKSKLLEFYLNQSVIDNYEFKLELLKEFYRDRAEIIFGNIVAKYLKITNKDINRLTIKKTKTLWGSCNYAKGYINLNVDLVLRDIRAVEYVILHEIAHLTHPNHSKQFYDYIAQFMPDWKFRESLIKH